MEDIETNVTEDMGLVNGDTFVEEVHTYDIPIRNLHWHLLASYFGTNMTYW